MDKLRLFLEQEKLLINESQISVTRAKLGAGAFGDAFIAEMNSVKYAAKVMKNSEKRILEITSEIVNHRKLQKLSQNIVKIIGVVLAKEIILIMELATCSLHDLILKQIKTGQKFSRETAMNYSIQICSALATCHRENIFHYDVKISNILFFENQNTMKLTDFGGSCTIGEIPNVVSVEYCPPEFFTGEKFYGSRYDVFSFGYLVYQIFDLDFFLWAHMLDDLKKYVSLFDYLKINRKGKKNLGYFTNTDPITEICRRCLAVKLEERYKDCQELLVDLLIR